MKKSTGIVRKLDELGRVVIPMELRRTLGLAEKDGIEIFVNGQEIILRKYAPGCTLCGGIDHELITLHADKPVCSNCINVFTKYAGKLQELKRDASQAV